MEDKELTEDQKTKIEQLKADGLPPIKLLYMTDDELEQVCKELQEQFILKD